MCDDFNTFQKILKYFKETTQIYAIKQGWVKKC